MLLRDMIWWFNELCRAHPILVADKMLREGIANISQLGIEKFTELRAILSTVSQLLACPINLPYRNRSNNILLVYYITKSVFYF